MDEKILDVGELNALFRGAETSEDILKLIDNDEELDKIISWTQRSGISISRVPKDNIRIFMRWWVENYFSLREKNIIDLEPIQGELVKVSMDENKFEDYILKKMGAS